MKALLLALIPVSVLAALPANPVLYVTQTPLPDEVLPSTHVIVEAKMSVASAMQSPLADSTHAARGGALWIRYPGPLSASNPRNLTAAAGLGGPVDANGNASGFQGANGIAVQHPSVHWSGTKAIFSMVVGAPLSASDATQFHWQLYEITNITQGQTPAITYVNGQPPNYNNYQACYDTQDRIIFVSDAPHGMLANIYPQLDQYISLPTNSGLWRLDRGTTPATLKQIIHAPSGAFSPFVDSTGRVMFVQWDHLSRDVFATYDRPPIASNGDAWTQTFNGNGTFDSETGSNFTLGTAANYPAYNFHPEPRNFDKTSLAGTNLNGNAFNQFFPWECREDGSSHETDRHVGRHELGGTQPGRPSFTDDPNLVQMSFAHPISLNFLHLTESPASPGTFYAVNSAEFGTHMAGPIVSYLSNAALNPDNMQPTYLTPPVSIPNPALGSAPLTTPVDIYRNPVPLANGSLLAVHTPVTQYDSNSGTAAAPKSRYAFHLRMLVSSGATMVPDSSLTVTSPQNVSLSYYAGGSLITYSGAPLWELDPVEVIDRTATKPAQLNSSIAAVEQSVFDEEGVHAPTYQKYLRNADLALVVGRNVTRRDAADRQQPFNLKVSWSTTQTVGAAGKIYDIGWMQFFQADALRAYTLNGTNVSAPPQPGRRLMPVALHGAALNEMPAAPGAPPGAVKLADDGSWAAVLPASRALTWQLLDGSGTSSQVKERMEVSFAPGEVRTCAVCHGVNSHDQAGNLGVPVTKPTALRAVLQFWKASHPPGSVQHTATATNVSKSAGVATIAVSRTGGSTGPVSVDFSTADGTAAAGTDYTATYGTLTWADGDTSAKSIAIPLLNNTVIGPSKSLTVTLSNPLYATVGSAAVNTTTIAETPFRTWLYNYFGGAANTTSGPTADNDGDGLPNLVEYATSQNPLASSSLPSVVPEGQNLTLTYLRRDDLTLSNVTVAVEWTTDLQGAWNTNGVTETVLGNVAGIETVKASVPMNGKAKLFLRLRATAQ